MKEKTFKKSKVSRKLLLGLTASLLFTGCSSNHKRNDFTNNNQNKMESSIDTSKIKNNKKNHYEEIKGDFDSGFIVKRKGNSVEKKKEISYQKGARTLSIRDYHGNSIVDALNLIGYDSSFSSRSKLAKEYGIKNYKGTARQNIRLLKKLKKDNFNYKKKIKTKKKKYKKAELVSVMVPSKVVKPTPAPTKKPQPTRNPLPTRIPGPIIWPTAFPVPTATVIPSMKPTPTATVIPSVKPTPTATVIPSVKPTPMATVIPSVKPAPTGTVVPPATITPTGRPVPVVTPAPVRTTAPVETARPTGTVIPTVIPTATTTPAGTIVPPATVTPGVTATPAPTVTITPSPTATIEPTETPGPTETPEPCQHGIYDKIDQTAGDDEYCYHLSYVCTECGETVSMDTNANKHSFVEYDNRPYDWYKECSKCFHTIDLPQNELANLMLKNLMAKISKTGMDFPSKNSFTSCLEKSPKTYIKRK